MHVPGYHLLGRLGEGGTGVVYRAAEERSGRVVAVKVLTGTCDQNLLARIQHDCRQAARFAGHPGVVAPVGTGIAADGRPWIATEFRDGGSLRQRVDETGRLPVEEALRLTAALAGTLAMLHGSGIVHGGIKPENVLLTSQDEPGFVDFGGYHVLEAPEVTWQTQRLTPMHAAPEVVNGRAPDARADIYALASTLYYLLAGRAAFHSDTEFGIAPLMLRLLTQPPPRIEDVPADVFDLLAIGMAKAPEDRYPDAVTFAQRLAAQLGDAPPPMPPLPTPSPSPSDNQNAQPYSPDAHSQAAPSPSSRQPYGASAQAAPSPSAPSPLSPSPQPYGASTQPQAAPSPSTPPSSPQQPYGSNAQPPGESPPRQRGAMVVISGMVALVLLAGAAVTAYFVIRPAPAPPRAGPAPPAQPDGTPNLVTPSVPEARLDQARPRNVKVVDNGAMARLTWDLPAPAEKLTIVVRQEPPGKEAVKILGLGTTSTRIVGLEQGTGYCFTVGAVAEPAQAKAIVAWAKKPKCIRGAEARGI